MKSSLSELLVRQGGALRRADHPDHHAAIDSALARDELVAPFRGVYHRPGADHAVRLHALGLADRDAVAVGASAEHLHGWTPAPPSVVSAASRLRPRPGYDLQRRTIPRQLVTRARGVRATNRALTAIDLATERDVAEVDAALRRRIPLRRLWDAYLATPNRRGRREVHQWLTDSRTEPWSASERAGHAALHAAGVRGWVANLSVPLDGEDATASPDIAFRALLLAVEIDGWEWHQSRDSFERDRDRDRRLAELGWQVVRFPAAWVLAHPEQFAASVTRIVAVRAVALVG